MCAPKNKALGILLPISLMVACTGGYLIGQRKTSVSGWKIVSDCQMLFASKDDVPVITITMSDNTKFVDLFVDSRPALRIESDRLNPAKLRLRVQHPFNDSTQSFMVDREKLKIAPSVEIDD